MVLVDQLFCDNFFVKITLNDLNAQSEFDKKFVTKKPVK